LELREKEHYELLNEEQQPAQEEKKEKGPEGFKEQIEKSKKLKK